MINRVSSSPIHRHGGKGDTNDASAEFFASVRAMLDEDDVLWQTGELGKVDFGAAVRGKYIAHLDIDVIDLVCRCCPCTRPSRWSASWTLYGDRAVAAMFAR